MLSQIRQTRAPLFRRLKTVLLGLIAMLLVATATTSATSAVAGGHPTSRPTIVLVHGAWADSSSWDSVVRRLQHDGYPVDAFPTPLRGLASDSAYLRAYLSAIAGPVVLVGHSYGGAVVTDAAVGSPGVKALVYLDAFAPDAGENVLQLAGPQSALANPDPTTVFRFVPAALPPTPTTDLYVLPAFFPAAFAGDLPRRQAAVLAATQRPVTFGALTEPSTTPAWKQLPSWYEVGTLDQVIPPDQQRLMAKRAHARISTVASAHLPMISKPGRVTGLIETAARSTT